MQMPHCLQCTQHMANHIVPTPHCIQCTHIAHAIVPMSQCIHSNQASRLASLQIVILPNGANHTNKLQPIRKRQTCTYAYKNCISYIQVDGVKSEEEILILVQRSLSCELHLICFDNWHLIAFHDGAQGWPSTPQWKLAWMISDRFSRFKLAPVEKIILLGL